jgi:hypothetical protein
MTGMHVHTYLYFHTVDFILDFSLLHLLKRGVDSYGYLPILQVIEFVHMK